MTTHITLAERLARVDAKQKTIEAHRKALEARLGKQERARETEKAVPHLLDATVVDDVRNASDPQHQGA